MDGLVNSLVIARFYLLRYRKMTAVINKRKLKNELLAHLKTLIEESLSSQIMIKTSRKDEGYCIVRLHCVRQKDYVRDESRY